MPHYFSHKSYPCQQACTNVIHLTLVQLVTPLANSNLCKYSHNVRNLETHGPKVINKPFVITVIPAPN